MYCIVLYLNKRLDKVLILHSREVVSHANVILTFGRIISMKQTLFKAKTGRTYSIKNRASARLSRFLVNLKIWNLKWDFTSINVPRTRKKKRTHEVAIHYDNNSHNTLELELIDTEQCLLKSTACLNSWAERSMHQIGKR